MAAESPFLVPPPRHFQVCLEVNNSMLRGLCKKEGVESARKEGGNWTMLELGTMPSAYDLMSILQR